MVRMKTGKPKGVLEWCQGSSCGRLCLTRRLTTQSSLIKGSEGVSSNGSSKLAQLNTGGRHDGYSSSLHMSVAACSAAPGIDADVNRLFGARDGPGRAVVDFTGERSCYGQRLLA